jgi:hypothetical protein
MNEKAAIFRTSNYTHIVNNRVNHPPQGRTLFNGCNCKTEVLQLLHLTNKDNSLISGNGSPFRPFGSQLRFFRRKTPLFIKIIVEGEGSVMSKDYIPGTTRNLTRGLKISAGLEVYAEEKDAL